MRCLRSRQEHLALAPEARRVAPPWTGSHVADVPRVQYAGEYLAFRTCERVESFEQLVQIVDQIEWREVGYDEIGAASMISGGTREKLAISAAIESDLPRVDQVPAMIAEEFTHSWIDVVSVDREAALGEKSRVDSRSRAEVEQLCRGRCNAEREFPES